MENQVNLCQTLIIYKGNEQNNKSSPSSTENTEVSSDDESSANLSSHTLPFEVAPFPSKGLGLRAVEAIEKGSVILSERPLLTCPTTTFNDRAYVESALGRIVGSLTSSDRDFFHHSLTDIFRDPAAPLTGRVRTNSLPCGRNGSHGAVYKNISLANHSCVPNAEYQWDGACKQGVLHALAPIPPGAEITISYIDMAPHKQRQARLKACFDFTCACALCGLSKKLRRDEDRRIRETAALELALYSEPHELRRDLDGAFAKFQRLAVLYGEGWQEHERDLDRLWAGIADLCVASMEPGEAVERLMSLTEVEVETAVMVVALWYAEYEDEGGVVCGTW